MGIQTIFAHVSCANLAISEDWYGRLFGRAADRHPMAGLAEWHFTDSAEVQLFEDPQTAGSSTLTLGVLPLESERSRLAAADLKPGPVEPTKDFFIVRLRDPDQNLVVLASAKKR